MQVIYHSTNDYTLKAFSLINVLIAAVDLNRFRAMSVFNRLLLSITDDEEAFVISKALSENMDRYAHVFLKSEKTNCIGLFKHNGA